MIGVMASDYEDVKKIGWRGGLTKETWRKNRRKGGRRRYGLALWREVDVERSGTRG
jgi:hypothetical protein